ncbi:MAG: nucleoside transporter C-terminal domain-containing protein, partial [Pseudomonadota bacterium]
MTEATPETVTDTNRAPASGRAHRSLWGDVARQFLMHKGAMAGTIVFVAIILLCFVGPFIHTIDPGRLDPRIGNQGMTWAHPMGTDNLGRDMLAQVMAGGQVSLAVGIAAMVIAFLGLLTAVNGLLGWAGGWVGLPQLSLELMLSYL